MNDVPLREYIEARIAEERRIRQTQRKGDREVVDQAFRSTKELAEKHNDLLKQMQERDKTYVSQEVYEERHRALQERMRRAEAWQAKFAGGMVVLGVIGVSNLIRIWAG